MSKFSNGSNAHVERRFIARWLVSALFICATALSAQDVGPDVGAIAGKVYDSSGAAFGRASIRARRTDLGPAGQAADQTDVKTYTTQTSADGVFTLADLPPGVYRLTAVVLDLLMFAKTGVTVEASKVSSVDVHLDDHYQLNTLGDNQLDKLEWDRAAVPAGPAPV